MKLVSLNNIEEKLPYLSIEELIALEEKIMKAIREKTKNKKDDNWKKDFLEISTWDHLQNTSGGKIDKWTIETF